MGGEDIVRGVRRLKADFGTKCSKFAGAACVEVLKAALANEGIRSSPRDVFIRGIPVELDLLVPREGEEPAFGLLYEPRQVAAVLEIKNSGCFSKEAFAKVGRDCERLRAANIPWAYVTLEERRGFPWAPSCDRLGSPCFTLAWHKKTGGPVELTEDWEKLVDFLRECVASDRAA